MLITASHELFQFSRRLFIQRKILLAQVSVIAQKVCPFLAPARPSSIASSPIADLPSLSWFHATAAPDPLPTPSNIRFYTNSRKHSSVGRRIKTFSPYLYTCRIRTRIITLHFYVRILTRFIGRILTRAHNLDWHLWVHLTPAIKSVLGI